MWLKINDTLINKNEILAIVPKEIKRKKTTKYEIVVHVKTYTQFSKTYIAEYDYETQWTMVYQSLIKDLTIKKE